MWFLSGPVTFYVHSFVMDILIVISVFLFTCISYKETPLFMHSYNLRADRRSVRSRSIYLGVHGEKSFRQSVCWYCLYAHEGTKPTKTGSLGNLILACSWNCLWVPLSQHSPINHISIRWHIAAQHFSPARRYASCPSVNPSSGFYAHGGSFWAET